MNATANLRTVTASVLYNLIQCERRVFLDAFEDSDRRDAVHPFVEFLWRNGMAAEERAIAEDGIQFLNLRDVPVDEREQATRKAMDRHEPLIYGGRISADDLLGEPDLLRLEGDRYVPIDVKSGVGLVDDGAAGKPKPHYAAQLALYVDILERLGISAGRYGYVWDSTGAEVRYDLTAAKGPRTPASLWDDYLALQAEARAILAGERETSAANASICPSCHWRTLCMEDLVARDDLTLLPELGRSKRDSLRGFATTIKEFAASDPAQYLDDKGKSTVKGLPEPTLLKFIRRAQLRFSGGKAYAKEEIHFPDAVTEVILDIEDHQFRDRCYLHGFLIRGNRDPESVRYEAFVDDSLDGSGEGQVFAGAWNYLRSLQPAALFTYSKHERTWWHKLQKRYPDVCSVEEMKAVFTDAVDLYGVIQASTEWPTDGFNLKSLATYCGFKWHDAEPSGATSIVWFEDYLAGDQSALTRIVEYNEDDCRATLALVDAVRALPVQS